MEMGLPKSWFTVGGPFPETNSWHKHMKNGWLVQTIVSGNVYNFLRGKLAVSFREGK